MLDSSELSKLPILLQTLRYSSRNTGVDLGDVWDVVPSGTTVLVERRRPKRKEPPLAVGMLTASDEFKETSKEPAACAWLKIKIEFPDGRRMNIYELGLRPAVIMGNELTGGQCVVVPGFSIDPANPEACKKLAHLPQLLVRYDRRYAASTFKAQKGKLPEGGRFHMWEVWSVGVESSSSSDGCMLPSPELVKRLWHLNDPGIFNETEDDVAPLESARHLLADILELREIPSWTSHAKGNPIRRRAEFVEVEFMPGEPRRPCIVVSTEGLHRGNRPVVVVVRLVPQEPFHAEEPYKLWFVPVSIPNRPAERFSADCSLLRGIVKTECIHSIETRPQHAEFARLVSRLRWLYGRK